MRMWLRELRTKNGFSQQYVAEKCGITQQYYNQIEIGERQKDMNLSLMQSLSKIFNVPLDYIAQKEREAEKTG